MNMDEFIDAEFDPTTVPTIHGSLFVNGQRICDGTLFINEEKQTGRLDFDASVTLEPPPPYENGIIKQSNAVEYAVADISLCVTPHFPHLHFRVV